MAKKHLVHMHSSVVAEGQPKLPDISTIMWGELAVNYAKDHETISIKNSSDEMASFKSDKYYQKIIEDNELTTSSALNDLNKRINEVSAATSSIGVAMGISSLSANVITLIGDDSGKSVRTIASEELVEQLIPESAQESMDTLQEIAEWIQAHPDDAAAMNLSINTLSGTCSGLSGTVKTMSENLTELSGTVKTMSENLTETIQSSVSSLTNTIIENELTTSSALNDLNERIKEIETMLSTMTAKN